MIYNGDLSISGPGGYSTVTGQQKLIQDLKCWLLESMGTDPSHPDYGSTLDGGIQPDGTYVDPAVGSLLTPLEELTIQAEIQRVCNAYQQQQVNRINQEVLLYGGKNTYSQGELLASVNNISLVQNGTTLTATISITTADGSNFTLTQPISSSS